jgi:hypothetical protein
MSTAPNVIEVEVQDRIHVARSQPRCKETGAICFDVTYTDGSWSRVPIQAFIDLEDDTFSHEDVADAVNDWVYTAKRHPDTRRNCICCNRRAVKGKVLCKECTRKWGSAVYAWMRD